MANCNRQQLNITCGTDVVLHDTLEFDGEVFDPALSTNIAANLVSSLGKRTPLEVEVTDGGLIIYVPWVERNAGYYGLEVTGTCNSKKWATYADSLIHYTRATEMGVAEVTIESDYYDITQVVGYRYSTSPINSVTATVDNEVGTPKVDTDYDGKNLSFAFHNLKGDPFTYDDLTPQQKAELKGEQGDSAVFDPTDPNPPDFEMANSKGQSTTKAMTQKAVTDAIEEVDRWEWTPQPVSTESGMWIDTTDRNNRWHSNSAYGSGGVNSVIPGARYLIQPSEHGSEFAFLKNVDNRTSGELPAYADGYTKPVWVYEDTIVVAPSTANYIYFRKKTGNYSSVLPTTFAKEVLLKTHIEEIDAHIEEHDNTVKQNNIWSTADVNYTGVVSRNIQGEKWFHGGPASNSCFLIPVTAGETYKATPQQGTYCRIEFLTKNPDYNDGVIEYATESALGNISVETQYTVPTGTMYMYVLNKYSSYDRKPASLQRVVFLKEHITDMSGDTSGETALVRNAWYQYSTSKNPQLPHLGILHYSDIHESSTAAAAILAAMEKIDAYVDDILFTGDAPGSVIGSIAPGDTYESAVKWWRNTGLAEKSLFTLGNHDDLINTNPGDRKDKAWSFSRYYSGYIDALGYVMPEGYNDPESPNYQACFWHKDYADAKIRLIGLDCRNRFDGVVDPSTGQETSPGRDYLTTEQEEWLVARLAETLDNSDDTAAGYRVVIATHYPLDDFDMTTPSHAGGWATRHGDVSNWHLASWDNYNAIGHWWWRNSTNSGGKGTVNNMGEIIKYYMEHGGHFVAWLCGHTHKSGLFYSDKFPDILNICIDKAGETRENWYVDRAQGSLTANYLGINHSYIKIARLGIKNNVLFQPMNYLCYDYINKKVISEG